MTTKRVKENIYIYDDNNNQIDCCMIHIDSDGREYYNPTNKHTKTGLFTDRIKDAIDCIRNDLGDAISHNNVFGRSFVKVVRFIDRDYGESIRMKSLEGWKDTEFAYAVKFYNPHSFNEGYIISKDKELMINDEDLSNTLTFESETEVETFIKQLDDDLKSYCDNKTSDDLLNMYKNHSIPEVYREMIIRELTKEDDSKSYNFKVIQIIKN